MIEVANITIKPDDKTLIKELNISFDCGQFWAIVGKNGAGKTTLLHTLAGLKTYHEGSIKVKQQELKKLDALSRAQNIAFLPQTLEASLNCSIEQSISYGRYPWHKEANDEQLDKKIIDSAIKTMELDLIRHNSIQKISGGELRKVEIATIIAQDSACFMLDEPLNHLDLSFRLKLMQQLKNLSHNKLIIMISHDIQYVQHYCSHVMMIMNDRTISGHIKEIMTPDNLTEMLGENVPDNFINKTL